MIFDTSAVIRAIRTGSDFEEGSISVITLIEILRGIEDKAKRDKTMALLEQSFDILDVTRDLASAYVELYFGLKKKGEVVSDADTLIAASARARNETVVTSDRDFLKFGSSVRVKLIPRV